MFIEVKTEKEQEEFKMILNCGWSENNWIHLDVKGKDYLYKNNLNKPVATLSLLEFNPVNQTFINDVFCFDKVEPIKSYIGNTVEVDNFTIIKEERGWNTMISCASSGAKLIFSDKNIKYCIAIVQPKFYRKVKFILSKSVKPLSDPIFCERDNCYFIPIYINVEKIRKSLRWLL